MANTDWTSQRRAFYQVEPLPYTYSVFNPVSCFSNKEYGYLEWSNFVEHRKIGLGSPRFVPAERRRRSRALIVARSFVEPHSLFRSTTHTRYLTRLNIITDTIVGELDQAGRAGGGAAATQLSAQSGPYISAIEPDTGEIFPPIDVPASNASNNLTVIGGLSRRVCDFITFQYKPIDLRS
ncbi:hypothetical protein EVAR_100751_1 [Eumeta japonica]|uniref:Uncharacterized protein n=1 Tax=Eumeta variegata TaxID=151549 RepID=A0A4C1ZBI0_EUMVA|nr:hypothetical protein EVAR_100751_1 [Eumeta japonica]